MNTMYKYPQPLLSGYFIFVKIVKKLFASFLIVFLFLLLCPNIPWAEDSMIKIVDTAWTNNVTDRNPQTRYADTVLTTQPLYLWMKVRGGEKALKFLEDSGELPVLHYWYSFFGPTLESEGVENPIDEINLKIGSQAELQKIRSSFINKGFFEWRTWSKKENIRPGRWKVKIFYEDYNPVMCEDKGCEYEIIVE